MNWDFGLTHLEKLFELHKPILDKPQSLGRIIVADALGKASPELVTKGQFKLLMVDEFKIRDEKLLDNVFLIADVDGEGALDIREICANILFHMRGPIELKLALFFEIMKNRKVPELEEGGFILKTNLLKIIDDSMKFFKQAFFTSKKIADAMNTSLNGQISFEEFQTYCQENPSSMDFLSRLSVCQGGFMNYPQPEANLVSQQLNELS